MERTGRRPALLTADVLGVDGPGLRDVFGSSDNGTAVGEQSDFVPFDSNSHHVLIEVDLPTLVQAPGEVLEIRMGLVPGRDVFPSMI